ncbi:uncharacterized protein LOC127852133 [Dreissena polymorpha]|nr:uncharacterized protein LOC127852133 [Dreissena polymorpha]
MVATGLVLLSVGIIIVILITFRRKRRKSRTASLYHIEVRSRDHWEHSNDSSLERVPRQDNENGLEDMNPYVDDNRLQDLENAFLHVDNSLGLREENPNMNADMAQCNELSLSEYDFEFDSGYASTKDCERRSTQNDPPPEYTGTCSGAREDANTIEQQNSYVYAVVNKVNMKKEVTSYGGNEYNSQSSLNSDDSSLKGSTVNSSELCTYSTNCSKSGDSAKEEFCLSDNETSSTAPAEELFDDEDDNCKHGISFEAKDEGNSARNADIEQNNQYADAAIYTQSDDLHITLTETGEMFVRILDPAEKAAVCDLPEFYI